MRRLLAAACVGALAAVMASAATGADSPPRASAAVSIGPFTGTARAHHDRFLHQDNGQSGDQRFEVNNRSEYNARFTYSFRILSDGQIQGRGDGAYDSVRWHLDGQNYDKGSFSCDPPVQAGPFEVSVSGYADEGVMHLRFDLIGAREHNGDYDCGAEYTGNATDSTYLSDSLATIQAAQPHGDIDANQANTSIPPLRKLEESGPADNRRIHLHEWEFTIQAPQGPINPGSGPSPGGRRRPGGEVSRICTIEGTARSDRLTGTDGNDVICAYGGNDRVRALGGDDIVFGGPHRDVITGGGGRDWLAGNAGRDFLRARDGVRDALRGGPGRDRARFDRGLDTRGSIP